ncbi:MAG: hypothetical protein L7F77_08305 [Candidatus Magnetominusculus sp. LBB02]|nr:hypothetical protein [Candidatus Magnetominusculus sp. LBB02]
MKKLFGIVKDVIEMEDDQVVRDNRCEGRVNVEIARFEKVAGAMFRRLEKSVEILEAIEASVDAKIAHFERLLQNADAVTYSDNGQNRRYEVLALTGKGLGIEEISNILGIQHGEIELILNLNR